jgi:hypothetical protein
MEGGSNILFFGFGIIVTSMLPSAAGATNWEWQRWGGRVKDGIFVLKKEGGMVNKRKGNGWHTQTLRYWP